MSSPVSVRDALAADRSLPYLFGLAGALWLGAGVAMTLAVGAGIGAALVGGPLAVPGPGQWLPLAAAVWTRPGDPGAALQSPWSVLAGHSVAYWVSTTGVLLGWAAPLTLLSLLAWRRWGPTPPGHSSRPEIRCALGLRALRRSARHSRRGLTAAQCRRAPLAEVATPLHRGPTGPIGIPLGTNIGTFAPPEAALVSDDLVHRATAAAGALLCLSPHPQLWHAAGAARERRTPDGVHACELSSPRRGPAALWCPISGCDTAATAHRRAHTIISSIAGHTDHADHSDEPGVTAHRHATAILAGLLQAAARRDYPIHCLGDWLTSPARARHAAGQLADPRPELTHALRADAEQPTTDRAWTYLHRLGDPLRDPCARELAAPRPSRGLDLDEHISAGGSLFLITGTGSDTPTPASPLMRALTAALIDEWFTTAHRLAASPTGTPLDPPATALVHDLPDTLPGWQLPELITRSDTAGLALHWTAPSRTQLTSTFSKEPVASLLDHTPTITVWGGLKDTATLEWACTLFGRHERVRARTDHATSGARSAVETDLVPTYQPGDLRALRHNRIIIVHKTLRPILARTTATPPRQRSSWVPHTNSTSQPDNAVSDVKSDGAPAPTAPIRPHPTPDPGRRTVHLDRPHRRPPHQPAPATPRSAEPAPHLTQPIPAPGPDPSYTTGTDAQQRQQAADSGPEEPAPTSTESAPPVAPPTRGVYWQMRIFGAREFRPTGPSPSVNTETTSSPSNLAAELGPRAWELLVYLAAHPDGVRRDTLVAALWPDAPPDRPTNALNAALQRLRRKLADHDPHAPSPIRLHGDRYQLDPRQIHTDYAQFWQAADPDNAPTEDQHLAAQRTILDIYRGPLGDGLTSEWILTIREAARRRFLDAVAGLARNTVTQDPALTISLLETARNIEPLEEGLYRDIIRLQTSLGQYDAAHRTLDLLTTQLADIGAHPDPRTVELAQRQPSATQDPHRRPNTKPPEAAPGKSPE